MKRIAHLFRRFFGSLSRRPPAGSEVAWAFSHLSQDEAALWMRMPVQDRRHSIVVARRFADRVANVDRAELAGALLHDAGKTASGLGTFGRVVATIIGPRTKRFRAYHNHELIGVEMLRAAGSAPATLALIDGTSPNSNALRVADST